ncbi:MAG: hypothetical protein JJT89_17845 [Nitriliruptoraceae bacterium]|nr:hypothetical protein [Nitriliruptoraceae bacterium]
MLSWIAVGGFIAGMVALSRRLARHDRDGSFDVEPSSVSQPGLRRFFDFGSSGWSQDGMRQRPRASRG